MTGGGPLPAGHGEGRAEERERDDRPGSWLQGGGRGIALVAAATVGLAAAAAVIAAAVTLAY